MSDIGLAAPLPIPPRVLYPERADPKRGKLDDLAAKLSAPFVVRGAKRRARQVAKIVPLVSTHEAEISAMDDTALRIAIREAALSLRRTALEDDTAIGRAFALIRELSGRISGQRHFPVQQMGAFALLKGMLAEMATGEGKTLTATLAAGAAGLAGLATHVVTVNDYLAQRDADLMRPLYAGLGLTVGVIVGGMSPADRRVAYAADITYCTNKELAFDYLRDRIVLGQNAGNMRLKLEGLGGGVDRLKDLRLRGLTFAIVDEADSVLVDEARTPLIISAQGDSPLDEAAITAALEAGRKLVEGADYRIIASERRAVLTAEGKDRVAALTEALGGVFASAVMREELARHAITALRLFHPGEHYLVRDGKVQIIDEYTGRLMPDRNWGEGLHQMVELKEGCKLTGGRVTIARMTYQRMFRRYRRLSGMSGTVREVADEMWTVYRLPVVKIPTNRPVQRKRLPDRVLADDTAKWDAIVGRVAELTGKGLPVLIGTRSVASSMAASARLDAAGVANVALSAAQDKEEAAIVARAGEAGRVTVATNMAGRGTDIKLAPGVAEAGGLQVIMAERNDSTRVDNQLAGRSGRQGEPGSFQPILSLEDPIVGPAGGFTARLARLAMRLFGEAGGRGALVHAQRRVERLHARMRADLLAADKKLNQTLAFSGKPE